jgi:hypothetical protein
VEVLKYPAGTSLFDAATRALHDLLRRDPGAGSIHMAMTFLQDQSIGAPEPYEPGEEFVVFLHWWPEERTLSPAQCIRLIAVTLAPSSSFKMGE